MVWYSHLFQNFPQFIVIHTVKGFGIVGKAEIDVFLELSCFFDLISGTVNLQFQGPYVPISLWPVLKCFISDAGNEGMGQRRQWHPTPVLWPGKSHGRRSLVGYSPWGHEESDTTEGLHFHFSRSCIGEGNGNPLQCSCLENPRDGGAWWAAVYGVAQSWT